MTDSVFYQKVVWPIKRSYVLSKGRMSIFSSLLLLKDRLSLNDESLIPIRQRYLYDYYTINTFQSISHRLIIIILHSNDLFSCIVVP